MALSVAMKRKTARSILEKYRNANVERRNLYSMNNDSNIHRTNGDKRLHVSFLINSMTDGGTESTVLTIIDSLLTRKHRVDLVLLNFQGQNLQKIPDGVNLFVLDREYHERRTLQGCSI